MTFAHCSIPPVTYFMEQGGGQMGGQGQRHSGAGQAHVSHHDGHGRLHQGPWQAQNHPGRVHIKH